MPLGSVEICRATMEEMPQCNCKADDEAPCGAESDCINRSMMYECHPLVCRAGDRCRNQVFQRKQVPLMKPFNTGSRGWGLKTLVDIEQVCLTATEMKPLPKLCCEYRNMIVLKYSTERICFQNT